jgi:cytoskeletal protein RodZ
MASFGEQLRRERELRGVGLREIADATKISIRFLQALEQDRLDVLPGGLFPRAFVKQYARYLGLDAERLVEEFVFAQGTPAPEPTASATVGREGRSRVTLLVLAGLSAVTLFWLVRGGSSPPPSAPAGSGRAPGAAPAASPSDRVYPPPTLAPAGEPSEAQGLTLTLNARQTCWVKVKADGETVLDEVLQEGQSKTLEAQGEIVLSVGNAGGLTFTVNDRRGVPLGRNGEVRRNIVITRESLPSLVQDDRSAASHSG